MDDKERSASVSVGQPERPVQTSKQDYLERGPFVRRLVTALIDSRTQRSTGIVLGITGEWGSGKSTVLNLLREEIKTQYPDAFVLTFDPWLVSGRNDLITEFLAELIATLRQTWWQKWKLRDLIRTLTKYGGYLAPAADVWTPGAGVIVKGSLTTVHAALSRDETLSTLRKRLNARLENIAAPIVVLIDEIDRVEDAEIRVITQLVRSVVDFPRISFVLAYDAGRVVYALGNGNADHGRAYLEKIVQLQIPLPITFDDELHRLLRAELEPMRTEVGLPDHFTAIDRYRQLIEILIPDVVSTPRDIKRLVGAYRAFGGLVRGEVDSIDLLGFGALVVKAPDSVEKIRKDPDRCVTNPISGREIARRMRNDQKPSVESLDSLVEGHNGASALRRLLLELFPALSRHDTTKRYVDPICERRALFTVLRLGLPPGFWGREKVESLLRDNSDSVSGRLRSAMEEDSIGDLLDRIDELYLTSTTDYVAFWRGVSAFARKPDLRWMIYYQPMHEVVRTCTAILTRAVKRAPEHASVAKSIFESLRVEHDISLVADWARYHVFCYGLFGRERRETEAKFLSESETTSAIIALSHEWRELHIAGRLLPAIWDLNAVFAMIDTNTWDAECRDVLVAAINNDDAALDGLTLLLFGGAYTVERASLDKLCGSDVYLQRVQSRLQQIGNIDVHESVRVAMTKAVRQLV